MTIANLIEADAFSPVILIFAGLTPLESCAISFCDMLRDGITIGISNSIEPLELMASYLRTVCLGPHLAKLAPAEHDAFIAEVQRRMPKPELDYVRLNIDATRG